MFVLFAYAIYFIYKSYQQAFKESKIDKLLEENKDIQSRFSYLETIIRAENELNQRFHIQSNLIEQIISSDNNAKDFRNQLREFLDNFVMATASINSVQKNESKVRIIIWKQEDDSKISSYVNSSNYSSKSSHTLRIDNSIVGRALRTQSQQKVINTHNDPEWNEKNEKKYTAVLAVPIMEQYDQGKFVVSFDFVNTDDKFISYLTRNALLIEALLNKTLFFGKVNSMELKNPFFDDMDENDLTF